MRFSISPLFRRVIGPAVCITIGCWAGCEPSKKAEVVQEPTKSPSLPVSVDGLAFADITQAQGLKHVFSSGEESGLLTILEMTGGGVGVLDFDRDGWDDLFFTGGGKLTINETPTGMSGSLWRNHAGKKFSNVVLEAHGDAATHYTQGVSCGDVDGDGFPDVLVTGYSGVHLFVNQGDGTFIESAIAAKLTDSLWSMSAAFADFDNDGFLDVYIEHYVDWSWSKHPDCYPIDSIRDICPPASFSALPDCIYMNNRDGTYRRVGEEVGLAPDGKGLGVIAADLNQDSKIDVYVANDTTNNFMFQNVGNGNFKEIGLLSSTATDDRGGANGSMGVCVLDYDGDLQTDIFVCNYENQTFALYKNEKEMFFRFVTSISGLSALGTAFVAFGTTAGDFDLDGDEDLVVANGHVVHHPRSGSIPQAPLFLMNNGKGKFVRSKFDESNYFSKKWRGRGLVAFDFDRDGDLDLSFSNSMEPSSLLENQTKTTGAWCILQLVGTRSNRDAIGSRVLFKTDKRTYLRNIVGGGSYLSQNPYYVHVAIPAGERLLQAEIVWPSGSSQIVEDLKVNAHNLLVESAE